MQMIYNERKQISDFLKPGWDYKGAAKTSVCEGYVHSQL